MNIVMIGPQGSGKGTQAKLLANETGAFHFSMGDALRNVAVEDSEFGRKVEGILDSGELVPSEVLESLVKTVASEHESIIFDGYPRQLEQAIFLDSVSEIGKVIIIEISREVSIMRISNRYHCPKCGREYNLLSKPPKNEGVCDIDGSELVQRDDDTPAAIEKRLELYKENTDSIIDYYTKKGTPIIRINGEQPVEKVLADIKNQL